MKNGSPSRYVASSVYAVWLTAAGALPVCARYRRLKGAASYPERLSLCGGIRPITGMPLHRRIGAAWGERTPNAAKSGSDFADFAGGNLQKMLDGGIRVCYTKCR